MSANVTYRLHGLIYTIRTSKLTLSLAGCDVCVGVHGTPEVPEVPKSLIFDIVVITEMSICLKFKLFTHLQHQFKL